jgi:anti-sigma factor RsiW
MMDRDLPVTEDELHAFVDGELPPDRRADVEAWLAAHPQDAARVVAWREQIDMIRARYAAVIDEPVPQGLSLERLRRATVHTWRWVAAASLAAFLIGGAAGWAGHSAWQGPPQSRVLTSEAMDAHKLYVAEVRHAVEVPADASHLIPWLSRRVGHQLRAPDLKALNLKLVGGRLLPAPHGAAALFMYEGASGERFTLYCARADEPSSALRYSDKGGVAAFHWIEDEVAYVVSGPAEKARLKKVAQAAYEQIELKPAAKNPNS